VETAMPLSSAFFRLVPRRSAPARGPPVEGGFESIAILSRTDNDLKRPVLLRKT
jgi:hypothetical protein